MRRYSLKNFYFVLLVMVLLTSAGCKQGRYGFMHQYLTRSINFYAYGLNWTFPLVAAPEFIAGDTVAFDVIVGVDEEDQRQRIHAPDLASKVEVDPGDGSGWLDFTQGWRDTVGSVAGTHVYQDPGEYNTILRVTYWDGEVLVDNSAITILPAPNDGEE